MLVYVDLEEPFIDSLNISKRLSCIIKIIVQIKHFYDFLIFSFL